ncbi:hypothetical protein TNCV_1461741 [Trichonephila clavipes]|nr:hypothetical protein TNCV_1461741 [Trichonephila clavipes]
MPKAVTLATYFVAEMLNFAAKTSLSAKLRKILKCPLDEKPLEYPRRSSCAAEQFHSDASLKAVDRQAPNNSKNWQWMTEVRSHSLPSRHPPGAVLQQDNARPNVAKTVRDFCSTQNKQLLLWLAYRLLSRRGFGYLASILGSTSCSLKRRTCCASKQYGILFHKQRFRICLTPCHVV